MTKEQYEEIKKAYEKEINESENCIEVLQVERDLDTQIKMYPYLGSICYEDNLPFTTKLNNIDIKKILKKHYPFLDIDVYFYYDFIKGNNYRCEIKWSVKKL